MPLPQQLQLPQPTMHNPPLMLLMRRLKSRKLKLLPLQPLPTLPLLTMHTPKLQTP